MFCAQCNGRVSLRDIVCPRCGATLSANMKLYNPIPLNRRSDTPLLTSNPKRVQAVKVIGVDTESAIAIKGNTLIESDSELEICYANLDQEATVLTSDMKPDYMPDILPDGCSTPSKAKVLSWWYVITMIVIVAIIAIIVIFLLIILAKGR